MGKPITEAQIQAARSVYESGESLTTAAKSIGLCVDTLRRRFDERGIKRRPRGWNDQYPASKVGTAPIGELPAEDGSLLQGLDDAILRSRARADREERRRQRLIEAGV